MHKHIIIFGRYPIPGKVKTRLIPFLGIERTTELYRRMTEHVVNVARNARCMMNNIAITFNYSGATEKDHIAWLGNDLNYIMQKKGNLGTRMLYAFESVFKECDASIILVGTDLPGLTLEIIYNSLQLLEDLDIVLGPATDGGYYLIGMNSLYPALFNSIDWGTKDVYEQTCRIIKHLKLRYANVEALGDIDCPDDLLLIKSDPRFKELIDEVQKSRI